MPQQHLRALQALNKNDPYGSLKDSWLPASDSLIQTAMQLEDDPLLQEVAEAFKLDASLFAV